MRCANPLAAAMALFLLTTTCALAEAVAAPTTIAVLDFDYFDTSGEPKDQKDEHDARLHDFMQSLRRDLAQSGAFRVVALDCGREPCSTRGTSPQELFDAAKKAGARLLLYGGVHKMSTLVQWAQTQIVDVEKNLLVDDRRLTFRGDDDEAWRRAEQYLARKLTEDANKEQAK